MSLEKLIIISSDDQAAGSSSNSDFVVDLKERYYTQNINRILVSQIVLPNAFYNIRSSTGLINNTLLIEQAGDPVATVTVPEGQYTIATYIIALKTAIDAQLTGGNVVTITQNATTQKLNFVFSLTATTIYAAVEGGAEQMAPVMGISANIGSGLNINAQYPPDLSGYNMVYVHSKDIADSHAIDGDFGLISVLNGVDLTDVQYGAFAYYQSNDNELSSIMYDQPRNLSRVRIVLRDAEGNKLDIGTKKMTVIIKVFFSN